MRRGTHVASVLAFGATLMVAATSARVSAQTAPSRAGAVAPAPLVAQNAAATSQAQQSNTAQIGTQTLQQVVITATHFVTQANATPLSVTAVTTNSLNLRGISNFADLVGTVPSLQINQALGTGLANISIRGIFQGGQGAATTGFYLDNTPLQKWNNSLTTGASENGTPLPPIFDLSRVEVLRGPQGTLFGASSEGGTIRYITPAPSLKSYHVYAKLDGSHTDHAKGENYSAGVAVGGPLIPNVLGFRASVYKQHQAGWIDMMDPYSREVFAQGLNSNDVEEFHGALRWTPTAEFAVTASLFNSFQSTPYAGSDVTLPEPYPIVIPEAGFNTTGVTEAHHSIAPRPVCIGAAACAAYTGTITYLRPGATYGPYDVPAYTVIGAKIQASQPASESLSIPELDLEYDFPGFSIQLFNSYVLDTAKQNEPDPTELGIAAVIDGHEGPYFLPQSVDLWANYPEKGYENFNTINRRKIWAEDLRFTSTQGPTQRGAGLFSWTAGLYYEHDWSTAGFDNLMPIGQMDGIAEAMYGITAAQRFGAPPIPEGALYENFAAFHETLSNTNAAVYGQANYNFTRDLQATLGLRESLVTFYFWEEHYGPVSATDVPTYQNGAMSTGRSSSSPFTPLGELTYRLSDSKLIYGLASEGFRPGGANTPLPASVCAQGAALYGLTVAQIPTTYNPDTDWNYELGTKLGLAKGRAQINAAVYRINWSNVQTTQAPGGGCGDQFTSNAGHAVSQGVEFDADAILFRALQMNAALSYDHAYYTEDAVAIKGPIRDLIVARKGENFDLPPWTVDLGAQYNFNTSGTFIPYFRADWHEVGSYTISEYPLGNYTPDYNYVPSAGLLNLRVGADVGDIDVNLYALNALNKATGAESGGRSGCINATCTLYTNRAAFVSMAPPQPLTVGVQFSYTR